MPALKKKAVKKTTKSPENRIDIGDEAVLALQNLRLQSREISHNWCNRIEADLAGLIEGLPELVNSASPKKKTAITKLLKKIHVLAMDLDIKPNKGRVRDIRLIHDQVDKILHLVENWDH